jgi:hypothetical protein
MPNTDDDANMEYIELYNPNSEILSLSGYYLKDKSEKSFFFAGSDILQPNESKKFFRTQTKITLNNTDEELWIYDKT